MTELKKGDRVKVEFEGRFISAPMDGIYSVICEDGLERWVPIGSVMRLGNCLPVKWGTVIQITEPGGHGFVYENIGGSWYGVGKEGSVVYSELDERARRDGYAILYEWKREKDDE